LQVGAYRQRSSAIAMRDKLVTAFQDVAIVEVQSGGEALYRVNVGRLPRGAALDEVRRRLIAAGYPAFEVPAPSVPASD
jgi:cell division protein FtsN